MCYSTIQPSIHACMPPTIIVHNWLITEIYMRQPSLCSEYNRINIPFIAAWSHAGYDRMHVPCVNAGACHSWMSITEKFSQ